MLQESISSRVTNFSIDEGKEDVYATTKVSQLSRIAMDLRKQVEKLKAQQIPRTPPEVLKEHRKKSSEDVDQINPGEKLYNEAVDTVSMVWEFLLEVETTEKFT